MLLLESFNIVKFSPLQYAAACKDLISKFRTAHDAMVTEGILAHDFTPFLEEYSLVRSGCKHCSLLCDKLGDATCNYWSRPACCDDPDQSVAALISMKYPYSMLCHSCLRWV